MMEFEAERRMQYFAIRQKSTGRFLPAGRGRGFTADEPRSHTIIPPRLFTNRRAASNALGWWLKGHAWADIDTGDIQSIPQAHRKANNMEIVIINLKVAE